MPGKPPRRRPIDELAGEQIKDRRLDGKKTTASTSWAAGTYYDNANRQKSKDNAADVLTKLGRQAEFVPGRPLGLQPARHPERGDRCRQAGAKVHIVGFDEDEATLRRHQGRPHSRRTVVAAAFFLFGYESVKLMNEPGEEPQTRRLPPDGIQYVPHPGHQERQRRGVPTRALRQMLGK